MRSLDILVVFMQVLSVCIIAAGAYLSLMHAGLLPAPRAMGRVAITASCVLCGAALGVLALTFSMPSTPAAAAAYAEPGWDAPHVMPVSVAMPFVPPGFVAYEAPAASPRGDGDFEVYDYH
jgi:hypothetical protein